MSNEEIKELLDLIWRMRQEQTAFFKTRYNRHLQAAKKLEKQVDEKLGQYRDNVNQLNLFNN